jgi:hypothetical protein
MMRRENHDAVVSLARMAADLVREIGAAAEAEQAQPIRRSMANAVRTIAFHLELLQGGLARNSVADALKGARLMGGISGGLSDTNWIDRHDDVRALALAVSKAGIEVAKSLDSERGLAS